MKKSVIVVFIFFLAFSATEAAACDLVECTPFETDGHVCVKADQIQEHLAEFPGINNPETFGHGEQTIRACGHGNEITSVEAEAELLQSEPYEESGELPLGEFEHSGDSLMYAYGAAGTNPICQTLHINIENTRCFNTNTSMTPNSMNSSLHANAHLSANITGAEVEFSALNEQVHNYTLERNDGAFQQGFVRTLISSGVMQD